MFKSLLLTLVLFSHGFVVAQPEEKVSSRITTVRVYRGRAGITQQAELTLTTGTHLLVFSGLSQQMEPQSVRLTGQGKGILQAVTYRVSYLNRTPAGDPFKVLEDSLRYTNFQLATLSNKQFALEREQELILKNNDLHSEKASFTTEELKKLADFYLSRLQEIKQELLKIAQQQEELMRHKQWQDQQRAQLLAMRDQPTNEVVVTYQAQASGPVQLVLEYLVNNAQWNPLYDLRVAQVGQPIQLGVKANVVNATGVNWQGVKLILSTATTLKGGALPELRPQYVNLEEPMREERETVRSMSKAMGPAAPVQRGLGAADADESSAAQVVAADRYTQETETALAVEYEIALPYDIPADGRERTVDIRQLNLPATYSYFAVPKYEPDAFLEASIAGWAEYNLLPGTANVFLEGAFLNQTYLNPAQFTDTLSIGLGRDPKVLIKREKSKDYSARKVIANKVQQTFAYTIEVRNNKREPIELKLEDQIPVSQNSEIEIKLLQPSGAVLSPDTGQLTWQLKLSANETRKLSFSYEAKFPRGKNITGL